MPTYRVEDTCDGFHVEMSARTGEDCVLDLSYLDVRRVLNGNLLLRGSLFVRRVGEELEFRIARPGVRAADREVGRVPASRFQVMA